MRYSIFEYSQEKLVSLNLDVVDALLLNWFANFFCGKMEKKIFKDADGNSKIYGWVKISKILEDLPVIGITSEKGIRVRFDSFVEKGILDRETINTQKGKKSYYRTTSVYDSLINTVALEKTQDTNSDKQKETTESLQRNCSSLAENSAKENQEIISHESFFTFAKNETENLSKNISQRNCSSLAERNETTFAQRNCSSLALNNSVFKDSLNINSSTTDQEKNKSQNTAEVDFLLNIINKLFNHQVNFSSDLTQKLLLSLEKANIPAAEYEKYILWAFDYLKPRCKPENFPGYFYKSVFESTLIYKFQLLRKEEIEKTKQEEAQKKAELVICKICGTEHSKYVNCPECDNEFYELQRLSPEEIQKRKLIYMLPKEIKEKYEEELAKVYSEFSNPFVEFATPEGRQKINEKIAEIENKYGLLEVVV